MKPVHIYFVAVLVILAGCRGPSSSTDSEEVMSYEWSESLMSREIHLSPKNPAEAKIRLVSVASDSAVTIRLDSGQQLSAKPGEYFPCDQFGSHGLQLVSASAETGRAELQQMRSETR